MFIVKKVTRFSIAALLFFVVHACALTPNEYCIPEIDAPYSDIRNRTEILFRDRLDEVLRVSHLMLMSGDDGTLTLKVDIENCGSGQVRPVIRAEYFDISGVALEHISQWQSLILPAGGEDSYRDSSLSRAVRVKLQIENEF